MNRSFTRASIDTPSALAVAQAALAHVSANGVPSTVAVVDESGVLKILIRQDGAILTSIQVAGDKAYTAAGTGGPTSQWLGVSKQVPELGIGLSSIDRFCPIPGGLPLTVGQSTVGGIGVSGGTPQQDEEAAEAGVSAFDN